MCLIINRLSTRFSPFGLDFARMSSMDRRCQAIALVILAGMTTVIAMGCKRMYQIFFPKIDTDTEKDNPDPHMSGDQDVSTNCNEDISMMGKTGLKAVLQVQGLEQISSEPTPEGLPGEDPPSVEDAVPHVLVSNHVVLSSAELWKQNSLGCIRKYLGDEYQIEEQKYDLPQAVVAVAQSIKVDILLEKPACSESSPIFDTVAQWLFTHTQSQLVILHCQPRDSRDIQQLLQQLEIRKALELAKTNNANPPIEIQKNLHVIELEKEIERKRLAEYQDKTIYQVSKTMKHFQKNLASVTRCYVAHIGDHYYACVQKPLEASKDNH